MQSAFLSQLNLTIMNTHIVKQLPLALMGILLLVSCYKEKKDITPFIGTDTTHIAGPYKEKARAVYDDIYNLYAVPGTNLFKENVPAQSGDPRYAYFWPYGGMFTAITLIRSLGYTDDYQKKFDNCAEGMEGYFDAGRSPAAYQAIPVSVGISDRYYDDNAQAGIDFLEAYEVTGNARFLEKAKLCYLFCKSGESSLQGGGLYWNEQVKNSLDDDNCIKATNVTALAAVLALKLYQVNQSQDYLTTALRWYKWVKTYMQDPSDKIYWNSIRIRDGAIDYTKWAYNTGAMITNACLLYIVTSDANYLSEAKSLAAASYKYFTRSVTGAGVFFPANDPWFTAVLFRGYLDLYTLDKTDTYIETIIRNTDYAMQFSRMPDTRQFYEDWSGTAPGRYYWILNQAAMAEIYARISTFKKEK